MSKQYISVAGNQTSATCEFTRFKCKVLKPYLRHKDCCSRVMLCNKLCELGYFPLIKWPYYRADYDTHLTITINICIQMCVELKSTYQVFDSVTQLYSGMTTSFFRNTNWTVREKCTG